MSQQSRFWLLCRPALSLCPAQVQQPWSVSLCNGVIHHVPVPRQQQLLLLPASPGQGQHGAPPGREKSQTHCGLRTAAPVTCTGVLLQPLSPVQVCSLVFHTSSNGRGSLPGLGVSWHRGKICCAPFPPSMCHPALSFAIQEWGSLETPPCVPLPGDSRTWQCIPSSLGSCSGRTAGLHSSTFSNIGFKFKESPPTTTLFNGVTSVVCCNSSLPAIKLNY